MFVRKRDPRYKAYTARQAKSTEQASTAPASGTTTPRRPAPTSTFVAQDWQKVAEPSDAAADLEWARAEGAEDEEWECVACNKTFRSEAAWSSHERSKKHLRAVEQLKREMQDEELELDLGQGGDKIADADVKDQVEGNQDPVMAGAEVTVDDGSGGDNDPPEATPDRTSGPFPKEERDATEGERDISPHHPGRQHQTQKTAHTSSSPSPTPPSAPKTARKGRADAAHGSSRQQQTDGDLAFSEENRETTLTLPGESHHVRNGGDGDEDDGAGTANSAKGESLSKREKRKAREAAKKVHESEAKSGCAVSLLDSILSHISIRGRAPSFFFFCLPYPFPYPRVDGPSFGHFWFKFDVTAYRHLSDQCNVCGETFESRTKLFEHVNREGHALADPRDRGDVPKKKGKKAKPA